MLLQLLLHELEGDNAAHDECSDKAGDDTELSSMLKMWPQCGVDEEALADELAQKRKTAIADLRG